MKNKTTKKMTLKEKKEFLDKLIAIEEEEKIEQGKIRLEQRSKKIDERRQNVTENLICGMNQNKESSQYPLIYKGKSFELSPFSVKIRDVKKV